MFRNYINLYSWNFGMNKAKDYFTTLCYKCVFLCANGAQDGWLLLSFLDSPCLVLIFLFFFSLYFQRRNLFLTCYTIICDSIFTEVLVGTIGLFSNSHQKMFALSLKLIKGSGIWNGNNVLLFLFLRFVI